MERMKKTAKILNKLFHMLQIVCLIAAVSALIGVLIVGAIFLFHLKPEQVATGYHALDIGFWELNLADNVVPEPAEVLVNAAVSMGLGAVMAVLAWLCVRCVRGILAPMQEGLPFQAAAEKGMKKLALLTVILGALSNAATMLSLFLTARCYGLPDLLVGRNITSVRMNYELDLTFLVVAAVLLLLSYVFGYGAKLQQQSDETL